MQLNFVTAGDYKDSRIKIKAFSGKLVLITPLLRREIELNKKTVERYEILDQSKGTEGFLNYRKAQIAIYFKNGKKSLAYVDPAIYQRLNEVLF